jgi:hypothetical protein
MKRGQGQEIFLGTSFPNFSNTPDFPAPVDPNEKLKSNVFAATTNRNMPKMKYIDLIT